MFGVSFVYVIFEDGTDIYWARTRVLEYLNFAADRLPPASRRRSARTPPASAGSISTPCAPRAAPLPNSAPSRTGTSATSCKSAGVAEVASVGGFVAVPGRPSIRANCGLQHSAGEVTDAIRDRNRDVGGRSVEMAETEYMVRGRGYLRGLGDIEQIVLDDRRHAGPVPTSPGSTGPDERRGIAELNGDGEVVAGIVVHALRRERPGGHQQVKQKLAEIAAPAGRRKRQPVYDRSDLIDRAIEPSSTR